MTQHRTNRDLPMVAWDTPVILPKGTLVRLIKNASGTEGDLWAVSSKKLLMALTGNTHDPKYRYCWVPADAVEEVPDNQPGAQLERIVERFQDIDLEDKIPRRPTK